MLAETSKTNPKTAPCERKSSSSSAFPYTDKVSDHGFKSEFHCYFSSTVKLIVDTGSIFEKDHIDAVVCSEDKDGHGKGYIARKLVEKGKVRYSSAKATAFRTAKSVQYGNVIVCKGEDTGFKKVLHTIMWNKNPKDSENERQDKFRKMFKAVFRKAVSEKCQSVVIPLLFTGKFNA